MAALMSESLHGRFHDKGVMRVYDHILLGYNNSLLEHNNIFLDNKMIV